MGLCTGPTKGETTVQLWLRTYVWTLFYELLAVVLSVLVGIGTVVTVQAILEGQPSLVLIIGLVGCLIALSVWWRYASKFVTEPDPVLNDPRPFSARLAADLTTALIGAGVVMISIIEIVVVDGSQVRWALLATILGGPFIALGLGAAWERWNKRTFG
jgi:hypothetical protein